MLQAFQAMESRRRLRRIAFYRRQVAPHPPGHAHERSAGPHPGHEMRNPAAGLLDDLRPGPIEMRLPVRRIVVLVRIEVTLRLSSVNLAAFPDCAVGALA